MDMDGYMACRWLRLAIIKRKATEWDVLHTPDANFTDAQKSPWANIKRQSKTGQSNQFKDGLETSNQDKTI